MDYQKVYNQIVERGKLRIEPKGYFESHHIIPRCLEGCDELENLVNLTAREHFLCHWLLVRIHVGNKKLEYAFWFMCNVKGKNQERYIPSSRTYQEAKQLHSKNTSNRHRGKIVSQETKDKVSISNTGRIRTEETREKIRKANLGREVSQETRDKLSISNTGKNTYIRSEETKRKLSLSHLGVKRGPHSQQHCENISKASLGKVKQPFSMETRMKMSESRKGKLHSEETKMKMSLVQVGRVITDEHKRKNSESRLGVKRGPYKKNVSN